MMLHKAIVLTRPVCILRKRKGQNTYSMVVEICRYRPLDKNNDESEGSYSSGIVCVVIKASSCKLAIRKMLRLGGRDQEYIRHPEYFRLGESLELLSLPKSNIIPVRRTLCFPRDMWEKHKYAESIDGEWL